MDLLILRNAWITYVAALAVVFYLAAEETVTFASDYLLTRFSFEKYNFNYNV